MQKKTLMVIERKNFRINHIIDIERNINNLRIFDMSDEEIHQDDIVRGEILEENESLLVIRNGAEHTSDKYCYVKIKKEIGLDHETKRFTIEKIIVDNNLINQNLFAHIFNIFLHQSDDIFTNRIVVPNAINARFHDNIDEVAQTIAAYITRLYTNFTNSTVCTSYEIQNN